MSREGEERGGEERGRRGKVGGRGAGWLGEPWEEMVRYVFTQTGKPEMSEAVLKRKREGEGAGGTEEWGRGGKEGGGGEWENPQVRQVMDRATQSLEEALERAQKRDYELMSKKLKQEVMDT